MTKPDELAIVEVIRLSIAWRDARRAVREHYRMSQSRDLPSDWAGELEGLRIGARDAARALCDAVDNLRGE